MSETLSNVAQCSSSPWRSHSDLLDRRHVGVSVTTGSVRRASEGCRSGHESRSVLA